MKHTYWLSVLSIAILSISACHRIGEKDKPYVVVISLDGFRWDYADRAKTPVLARDYRIRDRKAREDSAFYGGEPIWVTAEKQGINTASFFWVGSEAAVKGVRPTYWKRYNHGITFEQRIEPAPVDGDPDSIRHLLK
ncbi:MAG: alkaline phosphatase family protein [Bacteroidales bacterium]